MKREIKYVFIRALLIYLIIKYFIIIFFFFDKF